MDPLEVAFASPADEVLIPTLEITCDAWPAPVLLTHGYDNVTAGTEDGRTLTFEAGHREPDDHLCHRRRDRKIPEPDPTSRRCRETGPTDHAALPQHGPLQAEA